MRLAVLFLANNHYSKYNGKSTIEQLRRVIFLFPPRHFILSIRYTPLEGKIYFAPFYLSQLVCSSSSVIGRITLHGLPTATLLLGISLATTLPPPMTTLSPIVTPGIT